MTMVNEAEAAVRSPHVSLLSKAKTFAWYAQRPALYRELARKILKRQFTTETTLAAFQEDKRQGQAWCESQAVAPQELCQAMKIPEEIGVLSQLQPEAWAQAHEAFEACPVKMGGPANLDILHHFARHLEIEVAVETGVASGWSTLAVLLGFKKPTARLLSVDMPYAKRNNEAYVGCVVPQRLRQNWTLFRKPDRDALPEIVRREPRLDLAHHDSDKSYDGRLFAYGALWPHIRPGGVLMSDDIEDNLAFKHFAENQGQKPWVLAKELPGNFAGVLIKP